MRIKGAVEVLAEEDLFALRFNQDRDRSGGMARRVNAVEIVCAYPENRVGLESLVQRDGFIGQAVPGGGGPSVMAGFFNGNGVGFMGIEPEVRQFPA